jgi:hypothetical protein
VHGKYWLARNQDNVGSTVDRKGQTIIYKTVEKRQRKQKGQSRMNNPNAVATQDTERRQALFICLF